MPLSDTVRFSQPLRQAVLRKQARTPDPDAEAEARAREEAAALAAREEALREAHQKGLAEGRKEAARQAEARMQKLAGEVHAVMASLETERQALTAQVRELLPELVIEGVGRVLYGLEPDGETVHRIITSILDGFDSDDSQMRISLNPEDLTSLKEVAPELAETYPGLRLVPTTDLHRGECLVEGRFGVADARYSAKLSSLRKVME